MPKHSPSPHLSRRDVLKGSVAATLVPAGVALSTAGRAQSLKPVKMTLPWIANGSNYWPLIGKELGLFSKNGIDIEVSRGFGSVAAAQAVANRQFDFGVVFAGGNFLAAARQLPIVVLATVYYDATMGIALRADSPIRAPKDLEGRKLGIVPTSAEAPFWPAFAKATGIDTSKVSLVQVDSKVVERVLIDKQVDAITAIGTSSIPLIAAMGVPQRFMTWSKHGVELYAAQIVTRREILERDPDLCRAMVNSILASFAHTLREPKASLELFAKLVPEIGLTRAGMESARISQGITQYVTLAPEAMNHALGWTDMSKLPAMLDLVMEFGAPKDAVRPDPAALATNQFIGNIKLSAADWEKIRANTTEFAAYFADT